MLEKTFESPLDCKEIKPVHPKGNQSRIFIGRTDAKAEAPILWPPDVKGQLIGKDPEAGDSITDSMDIFEFEQTQAASGGQRSLVCCSPWGCKESDN